MPDFPDDADGIVLQHMQEDGIDLSRPRAIDFMVAAEDEQAAEKICAALKAQGYTAEAEFDPGELEDGLEPDEEDEEEFGPSWTVYVEVTMPPEHSELVRIQNELDEIAKPLGGYSDGWGTQAD